MLEPQLSGGQREWVDLKRVRKEYTDCRNWRAESGTNRTRVIPRLDYQP